MPGEIREPIPRRRVLAAAVACAALLAAALPASAPALDSYVPEDRTLYQDGHEGRYLMSGRWWYRPDPDNVGVDERWMRERVRSKAWQPVRVPNAWNATVRGHDSMTGTTGWYRKEFRLPDSDPNIDWILRFESVNYRSQVWLNGVPIGRNTGAYLPFELRTAGLKRTVPNVLVIRINNVRKPTDFPPAGLTRDGVPTGGWWNYGGILREVYLRKVDRIDVTNVRVRAELPCRTCNAKVQVRFTLRNLAPNRQRVFVGGTFGDRRLRFPRPVKLKPGRFGVIRDEFTVRRPRLWSPDDPNLYRIGIRVRSGSGDKGKVRTVGGYRLRYGIRSIEISPDGILMLNGRPVNLRGWGMHEDHPGVGSALNNRHRQRMFDEIRRSGATMMRTHYPLHPQFHELADRYGVFIWSEIPMYAMKTRYLKKRETRLLAAKMLRENIRTNRNHPSVLVWSIANELSTRPGPSQGYYIQRSANAARELDPTRPVGLAIPGYPSVEYQHRYEPIDLIGINDYFGWYPGPNGQLVDRNGLGPYLDRMREDYPTKAIMVTEFGAEANREGPVEEKGTHAFQFDWIGFHMDRFDERPWLAGALYWTLQEFRVRPNWSGGNPKPGPLLNIHQKGVVGFDGQDRKPGYHLLKHRFTSIDQTP